MHYLITGGAGFIGSNYAHRLLARGDRVTVYDNLSRCGATANLDWLIQYVEVHLPGITMSRPEGTYLAWLNCREAGIPGNPHEFFLQRAKVAVNDGAKFGRGGEGFVRLNFACPRSMLAEALERMERALLAT